MLRKSSRCSAPAKKTLTRPTSSSSLSRAMARFLIKQQEFADPIVGPDPYGIMQIEWHIIGNGLLVMAFLKGGQVHCVAQADASPQGNQLNVSVQLAEDQAVEEFGHLVPLR